MYIIRDYINLLKKENQLISIVGRDDITVEYLTYNSKEVKENSLFVCKGANFNKEYLEEALDKGACCYIIDANLAEKIDLDSIKGCATKIEVLDIRKAMAILVQLYYDYPLKKITLIGITGTKGKSTTAYFTKAILDEQAISKKHKLSGLISGIEIYNGRENIEANLTTPEIMELYKHLHIMNKEAIDCATMEVSSQGLKYERVDGIEFFVGAYLNLGEDHISPIEHNTFEDYKNSKLKLMKQCKNIAINIDDQYGEEFLKEAQKSQLNPNIITFSAEGNKEADIYAKNIQETDKGQEFILACNMKDNIVIKKMSLKLGGDFNVSNALAACSVGYILGIDVDYWKNGLKNAFVPGRMEEFYFQDKDLKIIVDYAHNKMSFESLLDSVSKKYKKEDITMVYGCPGKKALDRRKELPQISATRCGFTFITEEDEGAEPLEKICDEVYENLLAFQGCGKIVYDRRRAILEAIENAKKGGIVLVTGKGRETVQKRGDTYQYYPSDVEIVEEYLKYSCRI